MADERYFGGNTLASFLRSASSIADGDTTAGRFDSDHVDSCINIPTGGNEYIESGVFRDAASTTDMWLNYDFYYVNNGNGLQQDYILQSYYNSLGTEVGRLVVNSAFSSIVRFKYWNGSAFANYSSVSNEVLTEGARYILSAHIVAGASGTFELFKGGTSIITPTVGMDAAFTNIAKVRIYGVAASTAGHTWLSQIQSANFDLRSARLHQAAIDGEGAETDGTGVYTDINEAVLDDTTGINLPTTGNTHTFTKPAFTIPTGYSVDSLWVNSRAAVTSGDVDAIIRSGGTDYASGGLGASAALAPLYHYSATDPVTAGAWAQSGLDAAEVGLKKVA